MDIITRFFYRDNQFVICKKDGFYMAINTKDLDANGCLTRPLNGFQMFASKKLSSTLEQVKNHLDVIAYGFSREDLEKKPSILLDIVQGKYRA